MPEVYLPALGPDDYPEQMRDLALAEQFRVVAELVDACGNDSEQALLLMTTCRNVLMTVNAVFVDVRDVVGASEKPALLGRAIHELNDERFAAVDDALRTARVALAAAEDKLRAWERRTELAAVVDAEVQKFSPVDRERVRGVLGLSRQRINVALVYRPTEFDVDSTDGRAEELLAGLRRHVDRLRDVSRGLRAVANAMHRIADLVDHGEQSEMFGLDTKVERSDQSRAADAINSLRTVLLNDFWEGESQQDGEIVLTDAGCTLPADVVTVAELIPVRDLIARTAEDTLNDVRADLQRDFDANVAQKPMPEPFVVDLTSPPALHDLGIQAVPVVCEHGTVSGTLLVAAVSFGIPESWFSDEDSTYVFKPGKVETMANLCRKAVRTAASKGAQLIVMPEVFVPTAAVEDIYRLAENRGVIVVAGQEMFRDHTGVVNRAIVAIPGARERHEQRKQRPSVYEVRDNDFAGDGQARIFKRTTVGTFAVVMCSDYLEHELLATIHDDSHVDLVVVCARNPYPNVFTNLAVADTYRHYSNIVVANSQPDVGAVPASGEGTIATSPRRESPMVEPTTVVDLGNAADFGGGKPQLLIFELSCDAIAHRNHGRADSGYMSPPHGARRR